MQKIHSSRIEKSVFVITYGRSGSTLIQNMLNTLPGYLVRGENANMLAHLVRAWHELQHSEHRANMRRAAVKHRGGLPAGPERPWFGYDTVDENQLGQGLAEVFLRDVLRPSADTRAIGFKEIRWHLEPELFAPMLEFLGRYMPKARFIFNIRDHDEVARSGWWKNIERGVVLQELEQAEALYTSWQTTHPDEYLVLHYNEYASNPEAWRPLFDFLGEPFDLDLVQAVLGRKLTHLKDERNQG